MTCEFCQGSRIAGIHFPSDFDDREASRDGKVFVAACVECGKYDSDIEAAEVLARHTGWRIKRSMDKKDDTSLEARRAAKNKGWYRPFFEVSLADAEAVHERGVKP